MSHFSEILVSRLAQLGLVLCRPWALFAHRQPPPPPVNPQSILIIRLDHLGDMVMSQPAVATIRQAFPNAKITLLCASWNKPIAGMIGGIDEILTLNAPWHRGGDGWKAVRLFLASQKNRHYDLGIALRQWLGDLWLLHKVNCGYRLGYSMVGINTYLTKNLSLPLNLTHSSDLALNLLTALGIPFKTGVLPTLTPTVSGEIAADSFLKSRGLGEGKFIALHFFSRQEPRCWFLSEALQLAQMVYDTWGERTVFLGGPEEAGTYSNLENEHKFIINAAGFMDIQGTFSLLRHAHAFVGVDSGPAHLAATSGIPTLVLWSGQVPSEKTRPRGRQVNILVNPCPKAPCYQYKCSYPNIPCMATYTANSVFGYLSAMLSGS